MLCVSAERQRLSGVLCPCGVQSRLESGEVRFAHDYELGAIADWLDPSMVRGKGLSQAASRIDQFAYNAHDGQH